MNTSSLQGRDEALLRAAAYALAETIAPYRVLTGDRLAALSGETYWRAVGFQEALQWAVDHGVLRRLGDDFYETTRPS